MLTSGSIDCSRHTVIALDGEIDLSSAASVRASLVAAVNDRTDRSVVIDLRDVTFMDSTGIGALLSAYRRLKLQQRPMSVAAAQPIVARVLGITHIERLIPVVDTVDNAIGNCSDAHFVTHVATSTPDARARPLVVPDDLTTKP